jgi:hypothetical protein
MTRTSLSIALAALIALLAPSAPALAQESQPHGLPLPTSSSQHSPSDGAGALPLDSPADLALALRLREDPPRLIGAALNRFNWRQFLFPRRTHGFDTSPEIVAALEGYALEANRSLLPEFTSADYAGGRSIHWHLLNAIYMNSSRMPYYMQRAGDLRGRTRRLARYMIIGETVSLPSIRRFDRANDELKAATGVDFVDLLRPLNPLPPQTPPVYRGVATRAQVRQVKELGRQVRRDVQDAVAKQDLPRIAEVCRAAIVQLMAWEQAWGVHWHMSRHTIGSVGFTALMGLERAEVPGLRAMVFDYLKLNAKNTVSYGRQVDQLAQPLHARGLGMVVNEFTDQRFLDMYEAWQRPQTAGLTERISD